MPITNRKIKYLENRLNEIANKKIPKAPEYRDYLPGDLTIVAENVLQTGTGKMIHESLLHAKQSRKYYCNDNFICNLAKRLVLSDKKLRAQKEKYEADCAEHKVLRTKIIAQGTKIKDQIILGDLDKALDMLEKFEDG